MLVLSCYEVSSFIGICNPDGADFIAICNRFLSYGSRKPLFNYMEITRVDETVGRINLQSAILRDYKSRRTKKAAEFQ